MKVKITTYANVVYRIADKTLETAEGIYQGRIGEELELQFQKSDSGTVPYSVNITINNNDNYFAHNVDFWASSVEIEQDNGVKWFGKITFYAFDSDNNLNITATERTAPEFELQLPDEVRQVYTVDDNFHQSSVTMTIPLAIGGTVENPLLLPTILIDKTNGIYLICVGEIHQVVNVYRGSEKMTTGYTAYTGTSTQANHKGFAYVQIASEYRKNDDDSYAEITVEIVGLKLGNSTIAQCRNGARFLYWFLKTASSGINGWGCGISENDIDIDSFNTAITLVDNSGLKLDGVMWLRQSAQSWIDQICQAIHGSYSIGADGKRKLIIDNAQAVSKKTFTVANMRINRSGKNSYANVVYNKGSLSYGYNPVTGLFMQSAQYENALSVAKLGEQKFIGESYLINDADTALAILEYICKKSEIGAEAINFKTNDLSTDLFVGDIITINRPLINITGDYQITSISINDYTADITASKFDTSVFTVTGTNENVDWTEEAPIVSSVVPATPTNLVLNTGMEQKTNGTIDIYIDGSFTIPNGSWLFAAIQYGETSNPTTWNNLTTSANGAFRIIPVKPNTIYTIRVRLVTATGHSNYITSTITTAGDSTAPSAPTVTVSAPSVPANIVQNLNLTVTVSLANPPEDMAGFNLYRGTTNVSGSSTLIGFLSAKNGKATFTDVTPTVGNYYYWAKSVDVWGNASAYSSVATHTQDTTAPSAPTITVTVKQTTVNLSINLSTPPDDMAGFYLYRNANNTSSTATLLAFISAKDGKATFTDLTPSIGTYYYFAKSADVWNNQSAFTSGVSVTTQAVVADEVASTALSTPTGAILRLSAKGCTTASIANENGVIDVSGNGHHTKAYGDITVGYDEGGAYFDTGTNGYIAYNNNFNYLSDKFSVRIRFRTHVYPSVDSVYICSLNNNTSYEDQKFSLTVYQYGRYLLGVEGYLYSWITDNTSCIRDVVITRNSSNVVTLYVNGVKKNTFNVTQNLTRANLTLGCRSANSSGATTSRALHWQGKIYAFQIFDYDLSETQVKTLSMFPDEALFAQLSGDLIGANVITAKNLVKTSALITETAQISQAIVKDLVVTNGVTIGDLNTTAQNANTTAQNASNKINNLQVGGRNLLLNSNNGGNGWNNSNYPTCIIQLSPYKPIGTEQVTISIKIPDDYVIDTNVFKNIVIFNSGGNYHTTAIALNSNQHLYTLTFNWFGATQTSNIDLRFYVGLASGATRTNFRIDWVKLEYGNTPTTWTPSPEDVDADISTAQTTANTAVSNAATAQTTANTANTTANTANALANELDSLQMPTGEILWLSAKGCTTSSIAQANGVIDVSGNGNNGQAFGGVQVVQDSEIGACYSFDSSVSATQYLKINKTIDYSNDFSFYFSVKGTDFSHQYITFIDTRTLSMNENFMICLESASSFKIIFYALTSHDRYIAYKSTAVLNLNFKYDIAITFNYTNSQLKIYINGTLDSTHTITSTRNFISVDNTFIGNQVWLYTNMNIGGKISDVRIYPYALTASQVKALYKYGQQGQDTTSIVQLHSVMTTDYTNIQGGKIKTGIIASGSFDIDTYRSSGTGVQGTPTYDSTNQRYHGGTFTTAGSAYDLDYGEIHTPYFYSNSTGAGIKGHVEADSGKIGLFEIDINGQFKSYVDNVNQPTSGLITLTYEVTQNGTRHFQNTLIQQGSIRLVEEYTGTYAVPLIDTILTANGINTPNIYLRRDIINPDYVAILERYCFDLTNVGNTANSISIDARTGTISSKIFSGQLIHNSNTSWNGLTGAAVYSGTRVTGGVNYLWGVASKSADHYIGIGNLADNLEFVFFNNSTAYSGNSPTNRMYINAVDGNYVQIGSAGGYFKFLGHVCPNANNTYQLGVSGLSWKDIYVKAINGTSIGNNAVATFSSTSVSSNGTNTSSVYIHGVNLSGFKISVGYFTTGVSTQNSIVSLPFSYSTVLFAIATPAGTNAVYNYAVSVSSSTAIMSNLTKSKRHYILVIGV